MPSDGAEPDAEETRTERNSRAHLGLALAIVLVILVADQATKIWAVAELSDGPISIIGDDVELRLGRNTGGAFSLFQAFTPLLAVLAVVVAVFLVRAARRTTDTWMLVGLSLVLGGAVANLVDRIFRDPGFLRGAVVDFIQVGAWPTFNVADSAITVGAVFIVLRGWRA